MLKLHGAAALEGRDVTVGSKSNWIPETDGILHAQLALESAQRGSGVVGPVAPGAARQAILYVFTCQQNSHKATRTSR